MTQRSGRVKPSAVQALLIAVLACGFSPASRALAQQSAPEPATTATASPAPQPDAAARARTARRATWQPFASYVRRPSDIPVPARAELRLHARRLARLARLRALAEQAKDTSALERIETLRERESTRHTTALAQAWPALSGPKLSPEDEPDPREARPEDEEPEGMP